MDLAEAWFQQLIEKTECLIVAFKPSFPVVNDNEIEQLFADREALLSQLAERLNQTPELGRYKRLHKSLQEKEDELRELLQLSMQDLEQKIQEVKRGRVTSKQYNSYLRQMPFGAFVDKKK